MGARNFREYHCRSHRVGGKAEMLCTVRDKVQISEINKGREERRKATAVPPPLPPPATAATATTAGASATIHAGAAHPAFHHRFFCYVAPDESWFKSGAAGDIPTPHATEGGKPVQAASAALHDAAADFMGIARVASTTDHDGLRPLREWLGVLRSCPIFKQMAADAAAHNNKCPSHFGSW